MQPLYEGNSLEIREILQYFYILITKLDTQIICI